jgi:arsenite oxidase small subunit
MRKCNRLVNVGRRQFLRGGATAAAVGVVAVVTPTTKAKAAGPAAARLTYPSQRLANLGELKTEVPIEFSYPDADSPGVLIKLGQAVEGGVGPDGDIVAFSTMCPHKGFPLHYSTDDKSLHCPGHYSKFDCEKGGLQVWGQATQNLPQFILRVDDKGDIHAEGVDELLYGRVSNILSA